MLQLSPVDLQQHSKKLYIADRSRSSRLWSRCIHGENITYTMAVPVGL